ncbi:hypothetical protein [Acidovorax sp. FJL06]|uniref:hypothetical protein n=1 Tax=Acidovorax sp. FJL06 TaxID=2153365 RepID=UPI000F56617B|nr:hypothetical protein [Acidovorax sp. FJL06]RQO80453.1 hypothetical protein DBV10_19300 [Acidovorax sp. FJL06]
MNAKKISIGTKPSTRAAAAPAAADNWVENRVEEEPMKRLTIDIPASLHRAIKMQTAARGTKIADEVRQILQEKFGSN